MYIEPKTTLTFTINAHQNGQRIDAVLPELIPGYSRNFFQKLIDAQHIRVNDIVIHKSSHIVKTNDIVSVYFPESPLVLKSKEGAHDLPVSIIFEHEQFLIINKPAGLVVHAPSDQSTELTLVDWLLSHYPDIAPVGAAERAGIVHRLDKNTSGIMVVPRTNYALTQFGNMFKDRQVHKTYLAIVEGCPPEEGHIDYPIDRHRTEPTKMTHLYGSGRDALTYYNKLKQFDSYALLELKPVTGRTHQIRVHCTAIGHPLVGDIVYGKASDLIARHALHAHKLEFTFDGTLYSFTAPLPEDLSRLF